MGNANWAKWTSDQHVQEAQRLAEQDPPTAQSLALAQVHATLACERMLRDVSKRLNVSALGLR